MRRVLVPVLLALAAAPVAAASSTPTPKLTTFHLRTVHLTLVPHRSSVSCSARTRTDPRVAKVARKILPVACEQPPRSRIGLDLAHRAATAAAAALAP
jgi:hypothetical protein